MFKFFFFYTCSVSIFDSNKLVKLSCSILGERFIVHYDSTVILLIIHFYSFITFCVCLASRATRVKHYEFLFSNTLHFIRNECRQTQLCGHIEAKIEERFRILSEIDF